MKTFKTKLILSTLFFGLTMFATAQTPLPEVHIVASTYKYLNAADNKEMGQPVRMLEFKAASYDIKNSEYYNDEYDNYYVTFFIPNGTILASYDKDGKLLRTAEKFKNTQLPAAVRNAVGLSCPGWHISQDVYQVYYYNEKGTAEKTFKLLLEKGDKRLKLKVNENGQALKNLTE